MTTDATDPFVRVRGASEHNLRNVDVDIPRDAMVAFTGVSGSGKSSLAFGTLYAEAQRRYFESVAPYARRLLQQVGAPHVQEITGLPPAVALQQRRGAPTLAVDGRHHHHAVQPAADALLARRRLPAPAPTHLAAEAFSPNTAAGACPRCHGLGVVHDVTEELLVPDPSLSIRDGAIAAWPGAWQGANLRSIVTGLGIDIDRPWRRLRKKDRDWLLFTDEQPSVLIKPERDRIDYGYYGKFWSARKHVMHVLADSKSERMRERALRFVEDAPCPECHGSGLRPEALAVTFAGRSIAEVNALPLRRGRRAACGRVAELPGGDHTRSRCGSAPTWSPASRCCSTSAWATSASAAARRRSRPARRSGCGSRPSCARGCSASSTCSTSRRPGCTRPTPSRCSTCSTGSRRPATRCSSSSTTWTSYGAPTGSSTSARARARPAAGCSTAARSPASRTSRSRPPAPTCSAAPSGSSTTCATPQGWLHLRGVTRHNLRDVSVDVPLCVLTAVTGVSGSGKSTLVTQVLRRGARPAARSRSTGCVAAVDQRPIGRTPRSNLATYTGLFDAVRKLFAATDEARARGYGAGRFSFNVAEGRCETCQGEGFVAVELLFLPGTYAPCPTCHGARYNAETLEVTYRGRNVADVLAMSVDEAATFLADVPAAVRAASRRCATSASATCGSGQPATELSGGEAQRIKLATELQRARRGHALYLLDEPTSGLHPADIALLLRQLHRLVDAGNTVVLVEHDLDAIATADWVIDLGPGGGDAGGRVVATGTPGRGRRGRGQRDRAVPRAAARADLSCLRRE